MPKGEDSGDLQTSGSSESNASFVHGQDQERLGKPLPPRWAGRALARAEGPCLNHQRLDFLQINLAQSQKMQEGACVTSGLPPLPAGR